MNSDHNTILLVDDEDGIRRVLSISLEDMGYDVKTAADGAQALALFETFRPAIVITDIKMPVMDGIELLRQIKQQRPETEVIMITGHGELDLAIQSLKHDATDFVTKPINDDILSIALKRAEERLTLRRQIREHTENLERLVEEKSRRIVEAERLAAVGQTVAELSHAIKNIASGLKGGAFVLQKGIDLENRQYLVQGWEMLRGNVDKIIKLSLDLLDYAKSARIHRKPCDPNMPLHEIAELMVRRAEDLEIRLRVKVDPMINEICMDQEAIHRCLLNLVVNAFESCGDERCKMAEKSVTLSSQATDDGGVLYTVADNCCGMSEEVKAKLFQSFFTTKGSRGTGIGLMLTQKIVSEHKGRLTVDSAPGEGARLTIRLPRGTPDPPTELN